MSVPVELSALAEQIRRFGTTPFLLTVGEDLRPHAVSVPVDFDDGVITTRVGRSSRANAAERPDVTLLWPAVDDDGFSLLVDGRAQLGEDDRLTVTPVASVLHRTSARRADDPPGSDCVTVLR